VAPRAGTKGTKGTKGTHGAPASATTTGAKQSSEALPLGIGAGYPRARPNMHA